MIIAIGFRSKDTATLGIRVQVLEFKDLGVWRLGLRAQCLGLFGII